MVKKYTIFTKVFSTLGLPKGTILSQTPAFKVLSSSITFNYLHTAYTRASLKNWLSPIRVNESITWLLGNTPSPFNRQSSLDICFISGPCLLISSLGSIRKSKFSTKFIQTIAGSGSREELDFCWKACTVKKAFRYSRPQPGCHLPKSPWAAIMTSYINYSYPGRVW